MLAGRPRVYCWRSKCPADAILRAAIFNAAFMEHWHQPWTAQTTDGPSAARGLRNRFCTMIAVALVILLTLVMAMPACQSPPCPNEQAARHLMMELSSAHSGLQCHRSINREGGTVCGGRLTIGCRTRG